MFLNVGCRSIPVAGTGDIAFRLLWSVDSDLDLHVKDPLGNHLSYRNRSQDGGGILDVDCNAAFDRMCDRPMENIYWPDGIAQPGSYLFLGSRLRDYSSGSARQISSCGSRRWPSNLEFSTF